jgi:hypothetical protein
MKGKTMSLKQTVKLRIETGPGTPLQLSAFTNGETFAATLKAVFQILTSGPVYAGPEGAQPATFGKTTVHVEPTNFSSSAVGEPPSVVFVTECEGVVSLELSNEPDTLAPPGSA